MCSFLAGSDILIFLILHHRHLFLIICCDKESEQRNYRNKENLRNANCTAAPIWSWLINIWVHFILNCVLVLKNKYIRSCLVMSLHPHGQKKITTRKQNSILKIIKLLCDCLWYKKIYWQLRNIWKLFQKIIFLLFKQYLNMILKNWNLVSDCL